MNLRKAWTTMLCMATLGLAGCAGSRPEGLGLTDGRLAPCPDSPNCVSSQAETGYHGMDPVPLTIPPEEAEEILVSILAEMEEMDIVYAETGYIYAEASSRRFGFVDDVEFAIDEEEGLLHFRSASRLGYGDMGANRARMEKIVQRFTDAAAALHAPRTAGKVQQRAAVG